jgi:hypothetical protein
VKTFLKEYRLPQKNGVRLAPNGISALFKSIWKLVSWKKAGVITGNFSSRR